MIDFDVRFPKDATYAAWQKAKSKLDKLKAATRVTGLGALLKAAELKHKDVSFELLDVGNCTGFGGNPDHLNAPHEFDEAKQKAEQEVLNHVRPARQAIRTAALEAGKIAANEDKLFTATTAKAAGKIQVSLNAYEKRLREIKLNDFEERKLAKQETARQVLQIYARSLTNALNKGDEFVNKIRQTPTAASFNEGIQDACRDLYQLTGNVNKIKSQGAQLDKDQPEQILSDLKPWANDGVRLPKQANREAVTEAINQYAGIVNDIRVWWG